jgi:hypothetical protein
MQRHICSLQLGRICGRQATLAEEHAKMLAGTLALHCERATLCPSPSSERSPYDPYALLAGHLCYDIGFFIDLTNICVAVMFTLVSF